MQSVEKRSLHAQRRMHAQAGAHDSKCMFHFAFHPPKAHVICYSLLIEQLRNLVGLGERTVHATHAAQVRVVPWSHVQVPSPLVRPQRRAARSLGLTVGAPRPSEARAEGPYTSLQCTARRAGAVFAPRLSLRRS